MKKNRIIGLIALCAAAATTTAASADVITFEGLPNGLDIESTATPFANLSGGITSDLAGHLGAAIFDSTPSGPNASGPDPDLIVPGFGNILILQSTDDPDQTVENIWDTPNDELGGGTLFFDFDEAVRMISIDLIDINGGGMTTITLIDSSNLSRTYIVPDDWTGDIDEGQVGFGTLDLSTLLNQTGVGPGTPDAVASQDAGFNADDVVWMSVAFSGSGGLDNISFLMASDIPAPGSLALLGLAAFVTRRRRRNR